MRFRVRLRPSCRTWPRPAPKLQDVATFQVCVTRTEFLGSEWLAYGTVNGEFNNAKVLCKLQQDAISKVKVGEVQDIVVSRSQIRFFDKDTGLRAEAVPI